jgi:histidyl-tRNA synthetase
VGDDELASGTYQLKNMATGDQQSFTRTQLAAAIRR